MLPIVFIPGLLCDERLWRDQRVALSDLAPSSIADVAMFRGLPRPDFHLFHRCGHLPAIEQPDETSAVLRRWLTTTT
jgi:pimeloyl-ACP methyl ester carboxylesterase